MDAVMLVEVLTTMAACSSACGWWGRAPAAASAAALAASSASMTPMPRRNMRALRCSKAGSVLVEDLGSRNGMRHDDVLVDPVAGCIIHGGELLLGRTRVRVRTAAAPLPAERLLRAICCAATRSVLAVAGALLCSPSRHSYSGSPLQPALRNRCW